MIEYLKGEITGLSPAICVLECGGIGYFVNITLLDYDVLNSRGDEGKQTLYIHESIREDAHDLYGFCTKEARELFRLLIGVSGVGPNTARLILSSLTVEQLETTISTGNESMLKSVKGIGGKTAQRIIVDLKDKIKKTGTALNLSAPVSGAAFDDAVSALVMLGFSSQQSQKALKKIFSTEPTLSAEQAIKLALKML
ncbi:MAG: Holliday junction branch migration protein RuvA [Muribaculaceae bacterium]|nr:Holliday junction branch migration protein RuvA [Muribaculaceae bacterium]